MAIVDDELNIRDVLHNICSHRRFWWVSNTLYELDIQNAQKPITYLTCLNIIVARPSLVSIYVCAFACNIKHTQRHHKSSHNRTF